MRVSSVPHTVGEQSLCTELNVVKSARSHGENREKVFCGNPATLCKMLCWEFGTGKTFATFQAGSQHQLEAATVLTSHTETEHSRTWASKGTLGNA